MVDPLTLATLSALAASLAFSLRWNWWRLPKSGIPILMYHKIGNLPKTSRQKSLWITPQQFDWQLRYLRQKGYESITFKDLKENRLSPKPVIITFDDGYANVSLEALPLLKKYGFRAVFYIVAHAIGRENFWHDPTYALEGRMPMMSLENIKEMINWGMEFGSHTLTHRRLASLAREEAKKEIFESKKVLERLLGVPVISFAFPYGNGEDAPELVEMAFQAGYSWILGIHAGKYDRILYNRRPLPRIFVRGDDNKLDFILQLQSGRSRI